MKLKPIILIPQHKKIQLGIVDYLKPNCPNNLSVYASAAGGLTVHLEDKLFKICKKQAIGCWTTYKTLLLYDN